MQNYFSPVLPDDAAQGLSSLALAHVGDAVYELLVRTWLVARGKATGRGLHTAAIKLVSAEAQAAGAERVLPVLADAELAVFRRGRNSRPHSVPAHAGRALYAQATALEALFGWLYLTGRRERANELFRLIMEET